MCRMLTYPFHAATWPGISFRKPYTLLGYNTNKPNTSEYIEKNYAIYSNNYWRGVRQRAYNYRMVRKIEYDSERYD